MFSEIREELRNKGKCGCYECTMTEWIKRGDDMSVKESWFWERIRENLKLDFMRRVENKIEPGWPDVFYTNHGEVGWIELKAEEKFPNKIDFQPAQPNWLTDYWVAGGTCYVALYVKEEHAIYVWLGLHSRALAESGGTKNIDPLIRVRMDQRGWRELYEIFKADRRSKNY